MTKIPTEEEIMSIAQKLSDPEKREEILQELQEKLGLFLNQEHI